MFLIALLFEKYIPFGLFAIWYAFFQKKITKSSFYTYKISIIYFGMYFAFDF